MPKLFKLSLDIGDGDGESGGSGTIEIMMSNSDEVGGFQLDISDIPDYLTGTGVSTELDGFTVSGNDMNDGEYRVLGFSMQGDVIVPGDHVLFTLTYDIADGQGGEVETFFSEYIVSDPFGNALDVNDAYGGIFTVDFEEVKEDK